MSPLPVSSSSLLALDTLVPPSPELLPDTSITSGHIPILLDGLSLHSSNSDHAFLQDSSTVSDVFLVSNGEREDVLTTDSFDQQSLCGSSSVMFYSEDSQVYSRPPSALPSPISRHFNLSPTLSRLRRSLSPSKVLSSGPIGKLILPSKTGENTFMSCSDTLSTLDASVFTVPSLPVTPEPTPPPTPSKRYPFISTAILNALGRRSGSASSLHTIRVDPPTPSPSPRSKGHRRGISEQLGNTLRVPNLPKDLAFLRDTLVEAHIDQEGFRSVVLAFRLVGYSPHSRSLDSDASGAPAAEFMPVTRQAFHFHYAPFETAPVLRRLTIAGQQSRDHLTREAAMSLKSTGVYTIRGAETSNLPSGAGACGNKLRWKLEYMVTDRHKAAGNKILDGEKTLTPLLFACSPLLLHPLQGKKIRLIHVMKKSMIPSLVAEKMRPPALDFAPLAQSTPARSLGRVVKPNARSPHRRARSHAINEHCAVPDGHRRSASSAGERISTPTAAKFRGQAFVFDSDLSPCDENSVLSTEGYEECGIGAVEGHTLDFNSSLPPRIRVSLPRSDGHCYISRELNRKIE